MYLVTYLPPYVQVHLSGFTLVDRLLVCRVSAGGRPLQREAFRTAGECSRPPLGVRRHQCFVTNRKQQKYTISLHEYIVISVVGHFNEVALRRARLVLGWVTVSEFNCSKLILYTTILYIMSQLYCKLVICAHVTFTDIYFFSITSIACFSFNIAPARLLHSMLKS